jgi:hypothetical protein
MTQYREPHEVGAIKSSQMNGCMWGILGLIIVLTAVYSVLA